MKKQENIAAKKEETHSDPQVKEEIRCVCGDSKEDDFMILCDKCKSWLHCACVGIQRGNVPQGRYTCPRCILQILNRASNDESSKQGTEVESHLGNKRCASEVIYFYYCLYKGY
jgi:hypothetical protein